MFSLREFKLWGHDHGLDRDTCFFNNSARVIGTALFLLSLWRFRIFLR
jgi:hypothetical protein